MKVELTKAQIKSIIEDQKVNIAEWELYVETGEVSTQEFDALRIGALAIISSLENAK